jgi:hypothetical protein
MQEEASGSLAIFLDSVLQNASITQDVREVCQKPLNGQVSLGNTA